MLFFFFFEVCVFQIENTFLHANMWIVWEILLLQHGQTEIAFYLKLLQMYLPLKTFLTF